jgi:hypothetical protein
MRNWRVLLVRLEGMQMGVDIVQVDVLLDDGVYFCIILSLNHEFLLLAS